MSLSEDALRSTLSTPTPGLPITFKTSEESIIFLVTVTADLIKSPSYPLISDVSSSSERPTFFS